MKKINLLLLFLIFVSSCSINQKHQAAKYYDKTVDVKKCSNLICRKHKIHYNEAGIFFKNEYDGPVDNFFLIYNDSSSELIDVSLI